MFDSIPSHIIAIIAINGEVNRKQRKVPKQNETFCEIFNFDDSALQLFVSGVLWGFNFGEEYVYADLTGFGLLPKIWFKSAITDCYRFKLPIKKIELGLDY